MCAFGYFYGIKGRHFHIACFEGVGDKKGNPPVDEEEGKDDKNQGEKGEKRESKEEWNHYNARNQ